MTQISSVYFSQAGPQGGKLNTLVYLSILAAEHGMLWINSNELPRQPNGINRLGSNLGVMGQNIGVSRQQGQLDPINFRSHHHE